ncbi:MAG TPA: SUMF1/EgtB/PvdO family nonheme iron enzyme [Candidatus Eremiobacteraeota bacterium]|nr:SUMF1/EgtB/PvdO family nonheme iron enzyme [Candidatus Eremiobacteraeota bacterium]
MRRYLSFIIIALFVILAGCGGGNSITGVNSTSSDPLINPDPSDGTGTSIVRVEWPEEVINGITAAELPKSITNINIKVREGPYYNGEKNIFPPTQEAIFTGIPSGVANVEVTCTDSSEEVLSYRKAEVTILPNKTVRKLIYLGITIKAEGALDPNELEINVGDILYWYNTDSESHTLSSPFFSQTIPDRKIWSKLFNQGGTYKYRCDSQEGIIYVRGNSGTAMPDMVSVRGGKQFGMESSSSKYRVILSDYRIGRYEVTNSEYVEFLNEMGNQSEGGVTWVNIVDTGPYCGIEKKENGPYTVKSGYENRPVVYVSWYGAVAYCNWLSSKYGLTPCYGPAENRGLPSEWRTRNGYRLPTEAEWEYACRGGDPAVANFYSNYYWGNSMDPNNCWYNETNHTFVGYGGRHPLGLYDMSGNVWEWCNDWYGEYPSETTRENPTGPPEASTILGAVRIIRSGSWSDSDDDCLKSASRNYKLYSSRDNNIGFRLVQAEGEVERPEMVVIQGGQQFGMKDGENDPNADYQVTLSPYYIGKYEVTNSEYVKFLNEMGNSSEGGVTWVSIVADTHCGITAKGGGPPYIVKSGYENRPVVYVSWYGAVAYCNWLSEKNGLSKCYGEYSLDGSSRWGTDGEDFHREYSGYRLPTEAEWEYACRGGDENLTDFYSNYYWGSSLDVTTGIKKCWYGYGTGGTCDTGTHTDVDYGRSHPAGLYNMSGNVAEWCSDWFAAYPYGLQRDYRGPDTPDTGSGRRITRGGGWNIEADYCRSAIRYSVTPDFRVYNLGFRPVRSYY